MSVSAPPEADRKHRALSAMVVGLLAAAVGAVALPLIPQVRHDLGPATVTARARVGGGATVFVTPPLGTISAETHVTPVRLEVALSSVDVTALQKRLATGGRTALISDIDADLRGLARRLVVQIIAGAIAIGLLVAAVLPRRRLWNFVWAVLGACAAASTLIGLTIVDFDDAAFEEPHFSGELARAPQVLEAFERGSASLGELGSRYENLADRVAELMNLASRGPVADAPGDIAILHVSDVHSNPLGLEVAKRLARAFDVAAVVDTGDLTSFGEPVEARIAVLLDDLTFPYYLVPGNHDSVANRAQIERASDATVLDEETVDVSGIEVLGWADPTFTADNELSTEEGNDLRAAEADDVSASVEMLAPDVLAIHDVRLAEESIGEVPLVMAGHRHERSLEYRDGTLILTVGSTGATGLGSFLVESDLPYEAEVIHFRNGLPHAVDYIRFFGLSEEFEVDRELVDAERLGSP